MPRCERVRAGTVYHLFGAMDLSTPVVRMVLVVVAPTAAASKLIALSVSALLSEVCSTAPFHSAVSVTGALYESFA